MFVEHVRTNCINGNQLTCPTCQYQLDQNDYFENITAPYIYPFFAMGSKYECADCLSNRVSNFLIG